MLIKIEDKCTKPINQPSLKCIDGIIKSIIKLNSPTCNIYLPVEIAKYLELTKD